MQSMNAVLYKYVGCHVSHVLYSSLPKDVCLRKKSFQTCYANKEIYTITKKCFFFLLFTDVACLQEMAIMFACFKNNDFNQELCSKEIGTFQKCYKTFLDDKQIRKNEEQKGIITPGDKNLSSKQLNKYLKRFPPN
ncbi:hypothetical protein C0J52_01075 [Blattella germanica]|nr:hypothetical protein C0J52_01075 [Blattella germanica]